MTIQLEDLLEGTKVSVTWNKDGEEVTKEGSVVASNPGMLLVKPRGAMLGELITSDTLISVTELTEVSKITVRKLKIVKMGEARQHLADRHGLPLESEYLETEAIAFKYHEAIDHSGLSHVHEDKNESEQAQAIEAAAEGADANTEGDEG